MSTKTFTGAPKPERLPTPEEISAFEETGRAIAREQKIVAKAQKQKAANPEFREHGNRESSISANTDAQIHGEAEIQNSVNAGAQQSTNTEIHKPVDQVTRATEAIVRLTVDLPESTHTRFKAACAMTKRKMVEEVRSFIEQRAAELEALAGR